MSASTDVVARAAHVPVLAGQGAQGEAERPTSMNLMCLSEHRGKKETRPQGAETWGHTSLWPGCPLLGHPVSGSSCSMSGNLFACPPHYCREQEADLRALGLPPLAARGAAVVLRRLLAPDQGLEGKEVEAGDCLVSLERVSRARSEERVEAAGGVGGQ